MTEPPADAPTVDVDMDAARADAPLPERIGSYRVLSRLGEGGMGVVLEAEQETPKRKVALKLIHGWHAMDADHVRMFQREAASLARLSHPGIAAIYESGTADGHHFLAMELVEGVTLKEHIAERPALDRAELVHRLKLFGKIAEL
ncbi:MAG: protein kinase, partial [Deltaproteobacteria bacterium]|nr:protein kinase [Deltaproteobacteria bacterium]MBW2533282.1 protein kinase [Deltaproteobacteria bacterium]